MEEKELIVGEQSKKYQRIILYLGLGLLALFLLSYAFDIGSCRSGGVSWRREYMGGYQTAFRKNTILDIMVFNGSSFAIVSLFLDLGLILSVVGLIVYFEVSKTAIAVTNKRVYGVSSFGKSVDLPLDTISAVSSAACKGIAVASSSGTVKFKAIENYREIINTISGLLVERQEEKKVVKTTIKQEIPQSNADELKKFKDLLDSGIITQEEFDAKKKQLLGL